MQGIELGTGGQIATFSNEILLGEIQGLLTACQRPVEA